VTTANLKYKKHNKLISYLDLLNFAVSLEKNMRLKNQKKKKIVKIKTSNILFIRKNANNQITNYNPSLQKGTLIKLKTYMITVYAFK
jgi:hypothetical protein